MDRNQVVTRSKSNHCSIFVSEFKKSDKRCANEQHSHGMFVGWCHDLCTKIKIIDVGKHALF